MTITNDQLYTTLQSIERELTATKDAYYDEARKRDIRIEAAHRATMWNRRVAAGVAVLALVAIFIGFRGWQAQQEARRDRDVRSVATCQQYNAQQHNEILAAAVHDAKLADLLSPRPRTPAEQAAVDAGLKTLHQASVDGHPDRDCSPAGIAAYLKQKH
jgi:hypothetical protein